MIPEFSMTGLFWIGFLVALNGFFVATEFALVSVRRTRIDELIEQGRGDAIRVRTAIKDLDRYIAGTQVGITIASLALGWLGEPAVAHLLEPALHMITDDLSPVVMHSISAVVGFMLITVLHVVLGELVPKSLALQRPEQVSLWVVRPMGWAVALFQPLIWSLNGLGNALLRMLGLEPAGEHHGSHSPDEIQILVRQSYEAGMLDDAERRIIQRTFHFSELTIAEILTPRGDMATVDLSADKAQIAKTVAESGHSRLPVYDKEPEEIVGIIHSADVLRSLGAEGSLKDLDIRSLVRPALLMPETAHVADILERFQAERTQIAIAVDEYGSIAGLVTLQDVIDEVFGEINESMTPEQPPIRKQPDGSFLVRGSVRLDEIIEPIGWRLEDEEVDTLAGLVMKTLGRVAKPGDEIQTEFGRIHVTRATKTKILELRLTSRAE